MKTGLHKGITAAALSIFLTASMAGAMDHSKGDMANTPQSADKIDEVKRLGVHIQTSNLDKVRFEYNLLEMKKAAVAKMEMDHSAGTLKSQHLMLFAADKMGKAISGAKVGYQVTGPDGKIQRAIAMAMTAGYGADVEMTAKGKYEVKTKLVKDDLQVVDTFTYEAK